MGDVKLTKADYIVGTQTLDVLEMLNKIKAENYGAIEIPMAKLDDDLRKDNRIVTPPDSELLRLNPPRIVVDYTDEKGIPHHIEKTGSAQPPKALPPDAREHFEGDDTVNIGSRSTWGKLIQQPFSILKDFSLTAAKGSFIFAIALFWTLVVTWTYVQWSYICTEMTPPNGAGNPLLYNADNFGILSQYILIVTAAVMGGLAWVTSRFDVWISKFEFRGKPIGMPQYGWLTRAIMTLTSGLAPVGGFFLQLMFWFTVVRPIQIFNTNPPPEVSITDTLKNMGV